MQKFFLSKIFFIAVLLFSCTIANFSILHAAPFVKDNDRLLIAGDSITAQRLYSVYIESYLLLCSGLKDVKVLHMGRGGNTARGFAERMENDGMFWHPSIVSTCFGMNDGQYSAYDDKIGNTYRQNMEQIVDFFTGKGIKVIIGSPGVADSKFYKRNNISPAVYNQTLAKLTEIDKAIAEAKSCVFANLHETMMDSMIKAKTALGEDYAIAGDGIHPGTNGHLVMAYAFLKAMGFDGKIALIEMDWNGKTSASEGHKVLNESQGCVEMESIRYPFCGDFSIYPYVSFQQDLNRFTLKVKNIPCEKAEVFWGDSKKIFSREDLERGVNLAEEFLKNPFSRQFSKVSYAITLKQGVDAGIIYGFITHIKNFNDINGGATKETDAALNILKEKLLAKQVEADVKLRAEIIPIKHIIKITPVTQ